MNSIITPQAKIRMALRDSITREVSNRYAEERKVAGFTRRLMIWFRIQKEVRAELNRRLPPQALYFGSKAL
jgi:hypothetical protein